MRVYFMLNFMRLCAAQAWYLFNDANVSAFDLSRLNGANAYVLFYQQLPDSERRAE